MFERGKKNNEKKTPTKNRTNKHTNKQNNNKQTDFNKETNTMAKNMVTVKFCRTNLCLDDDDITAFCYDNDSTVAAGAALFTVRSIGCLFLSSG